MRFVNVVVAAAGLESSCWCFQTLFASHHFINFFAYILNTKGITSDYPSYETMAEPSVLEMNTRIAAEVCSKTVIALSSHSPNTPSYPCKKECHLNTTIVRQREAPLGTTHLHGQRTGNAVG